MFPTVSQIDKKEIIANSLFSENQVLLTYDEKLIKGETGLEMTEL